MNLLVAFGLGAIDACFYVVASLLLIDKFRLKIAPQQSRNI
ncbi:MAG: hypothetical protein RBT11_11120 [Desulfobacterales bacterium]|jgi:hypothetical protein|nr:hypothetical protein [Desulfobacterales bacterium]